VKAPIRFGSCSSRTWRISCSQCMLLRPLPSYSLLLSNGRDFASCTLSNGRRPNARWSRFTVLQLRQYCKPLDTVWGVHLHWGLQQLPNRWGPILIFSALGCQVAIRLCRHSASAQSPLARMCAMGLYYRALEVDFSRGGSGAPCGPCVRGRVGTGRDSRGPGVMITEGNYCREFEMMHCQPFSAFVFPSNALQQPLACSK